MPAVTALHRRRPSAVRVTTTSLLPGLLVAGAIAAVATGLGSLAPTIGSPVIAIVLGVLLSAAVRKVPRSRSGIGFTSKRVLQVAVVLFGAQLSLRQVVRVGAGSLPVMLGTLTVCLALAYVLGRKLGIDSDLRTLIGVGTAICGASAIAAVSPTIRAKSSAVAYAISTIFLFNIAAVFAFPPVGHLLGLSQHAFGLFAGTAVNDTSSVVAAAASYGDEASHYAIVVKLTRTLMIIPICLVLAALTERRAAAQNAAATTATAQGTQGVQTTVSGATGTKVAVARRNPLMRAIRLIPWFLIGFVVVAALNSLGAIPAASHAQLQRLTVFLITMALAAIGLSTDVGALRSAGHRPLLLGLCLWMAVTATSLLLQLAGA